MLYMLDGLLTWTAHSEHQEVWAGPSWSSFALKVRSLLLPGFQDPYNIRYHLPFTKVGPLAHPVRSHTLAHRVQNIAKLTPMGPSLEGKGEAEQAQAHSKQSYPIRFIRGSTSGKISHCNHMIGMDSLQAAANLACHAVCFMAVF
jgi:hypothetical protein